MKIALFCLLLTGCGYPYPLHAHKWGEWMETKVGTLTKRMQFMPTPAPAAGTTWTWNL